MTDLDAFTNFMRLVAGRTSCELHLSALGADAGVAHNTVRAWISILAAGFVLFTLPGWHRNPRKQAIKAPKLHLFDSGLVCNLLGITAPDQLRHHPLRGAIFESWVAAEIYKARMHARREPRLFHVRDAKGLDVDLLLEQGNRAVAVESKSGATIASDFFDGLRRLRATVESSRADLSFEARLVYGGQEPQHRTQTDVIPWHAVQDAVWSA